MCDGYMAFSLHFKASTQSHAICAAIYIRTDMVIGALEINFSALNFPIYNNDSLSLYLVL